MVVILFAIVSYFTWGTGLLFEAIVARKLNSYSLIFWSLFFSLLSLSFYVPFATPDLKNLTLSLLLYIIVINIFGLFLGSIAYINALKISNRALVGTIASSFPAIAVLVSVIFLNEQVSTQQIIAILIIFIGLIFSSLDIKDIKNKNIFSDKGVLLAFITMICWGVWIALLKIPINGREFLMLVLVLAKLYLFSTFTLFIYLP